MNLLKKIDIYYICTLLFVLLSGSASILSSNPLCWFVILGFLFLVGIVKKAFDIVSLRKIGIFSLIYIVFVLLRDFGVNNLNEQFLLSDGYYLVKFIYISFIFSCLLKEKAAYYIVKVIEHLTILSFVLFFLQIIGFNEYMYSFSNSLNLKTDSQVPGYTNFIIFTYTKGLHDFRNSGFAWEPGAFGCFLIIALLLHFFLNKFKFDKKAYLFIIAIVSTLSTTDYLALLVVLFLAYRVKTKLNWWAVLFALGAVSIILLTPILGDKISDTYYEDMDDLNRLKYLEIFYARRGRQIPLNRFSSMMYIIETFKTQLILGVSNKYDAILNAKFNINISNGIFDFLAKFGVVGLVYMVYRYMLFCFGLLKNWEFVIYCVIALLVIGFGEPVLILPIVLIFMFLPSKQINLDDLQRSEKFRNLLSPN